MGLFRKTYQTPEMKGLSARELLARARGASDPRDAYAYLIQAETLEPDCLAVQRELLMRGRLHERNPKHISFFVIKSYVMHAFEHPEKHEERERQRMIREIFDHPRLQRCLALAERPDAFLEDYLQELCRDYMRIFIMPDTTHRPSVLGITVSGRMPAAMAVPGGEVLRNILSSPWLSEREQTLLGKAFYRAYGACMNGAVQPLDARLGENIARLLE